jgi:hypothetical protein
LEGRGLSRRAAQRDQAGQDGDKLSSALLRQAGFCRNKFGPYIALHDACARLFESGARAETFWGTRG